MADKNHSEIRTDAPAIAIDDADIILVWQSGATRAMTYGELRQRIERGVNGQFQTEHTIASPSGLKCVKKTVAFTRDLTPSQTADLFLNGDNTKTTLDLPTGLHYITGTMVAKGADSFWGYATDRMFWRIIAVFSVGTDVSHTIDSQYFLLDGSNATHVTDTAFSFDGTEKRIKLSATNASVNNINISAILEVSSYTES